MPKYNFYHIIYFKFLRFFRKFFNEGSTGSSEVTATGWFSLILSFNFSMFYELLCRFNYLEYSKKISNNIFIISFCIIFLINYLYFVNSGKYYQVYLKNKQSKLLSSVLVLVWVMVSIYFKCKSWFI